MTLASAPSAFSLEKQEIRPVPSVTCSGADNQNETYLPNVVLFGETGVGKSSLINLIAGQHLAQCSNDAVGSTTEPHRYDVHFPSGTPGSAPTVALWDTAGLDEGTHGAVPATTAATHLKILLHNLARSPSGVHLLLFCIRGTTRMTRALVRQYNLVYASICRKKVPIVLVVTGLEHLYAHEPAEVGMERWWAAHAEEVVRLGMTFDAHACVTTVVVDGFQDRRIASQRRLQEIVVAGTHPGTAPWRFPQSWQSVVVSSLYRLVYMRRTLDLSGESGVDTSSGVHRYYTVLKRWLANMAKSIANPRDATLVKTITR